MIDESTLSADSIESWTENDIRPQQTTAVHRGGAVLKFKLG